MNHNLLVGQQLSGALQLFAGSLQKTLNAEYQ